MSIVSTCLAVLASCRKALVKLALAGPFSSLLAQKGEKPLGFISGTVGSTFSVRGVFADQRALTIVNSLMSGCGQGHELIEN